MSRWFRLDDDVINDPKILLLPETMRWIWIAFLCIASKNNGALPAIEIIALSLRVKTTKAAEYLTRLVIAGLIDKTDTGFEPHNWNGRQYKSDVADETAAERMKRYRERKRNGRNAAVTVTRTREQITDTDTQAEKKETRANALADGWPADFRDRFWARYPNKVGKPKAIAKLESCMKRGVEFDAIMAGLEAYIAAKPDDRAWLNPETFINQERWTDQPAKVNGRRTVQQAADDLIAQLRAFDEPAPDGLCDGTGQDAIRLLPPN